MLIYLYLRLQATVDILHAALSPARRPLEPRPQAPLSWLAVYTLGLRNLQLLAHITPSTGLAPVRTSMMAYNVG
jgi:hypothetical protein